MCGIAGIIDMAGHGQLPLHIRQMNHTLRHRGPDDEGFAFFAPEKCETAGGPDTPAKVWRSTLAYSPTQKAEQVIGSYQVALGHRRLSIISPGSEGHQPFCSPDQNLWLVFNGEVYNYQELRMELRMLGYTFSTSTDTEVVLTAYRAWGPACQNRFNGMWALAIYDRQQQSLFLSRDRFGVKPLYYYQGQGYFAFASEQKALIQLPFVQTGINQVAAFDYLALGQFNTQEHLFLNISEVPPAHSLTLQVSTGKQQLNRYYTLATTRQSASFNADKASRYAEEVRDLVKESVRDRLQADVPVGACLSGGLDSSSIVALIHQLTLEQGLAQVGRRPNVFTASFTGTSIDESHWARQVAEATDSTWHQVHPQAQGLLEDLETLVYAHDIPFFNSSSYAQFSVMRQVKEAGITVTLDGQGADELFAGYALHYLPFWREMARKGQFPQLVSEVEQSPLWRSQIKGLGTHLIKSQLRKSSFLFWKSAPYTQGPEWQYLNQSFLKEQSTYIGEKERHSLTSLNQTLADYFTGWYLQMLLRTADRNSMWSSVESRTPFVDDHRLVEYVFSLPAIYKIHEGQSKYLLRESMRGILPETVRTRKDKIGFATPENDWLPQLKDGVRQYITPDLNDFIDTQALLKNWDTAFATAAQKDTTRLWRLINFAVWKKVYCL